MLVAVEAPARMEVISAVLVVEEMVAAILVSAVVQIPVEVVGQALATTTACLKVPKEDLVS
jgi:hypothetical protein